MEMLMKVPSEIDFPFAAPTSSTSGVGSTPGKSTKKMAV